MEETVDLIIELHRSTPKLQQAPPVRHTGSSGTITCASSNSKSYSHSNNVGNQVQSPEITRTFQTVDNLLILSTIGAK